jgi:hypothetical protein
MANFRRKRPRKQPASYMSSFDRVDKPPRARHVVVDESCDRPKPKTRKPFVVENRYVGGADFMKRIGAGEWRTWKRYATRESALRGMASAQRHEDEMKKRIGRWSWEFRLIEPTSE